MEAKEKHKDRIAEAFANPEKITHALAQGVRKGGQGLNLSN